MQNETIIKGQMKYSFTKLNDVTYNMKFMDVMLSGSPNIAHLELSKKNKNYSKIMK